MSPNQLNAYQNFAICAKSPLRTVIIGLYAMGDLEEAETNVAIGYRAGYNNKTGSNNVFLGTEAGENELGSHKLYIATTGTSTPLILGAFPNASLQFNAEQLGFNKKGPVVLINENLSTGTLKVKNGGYGFETEAEAKAAMKFIELFSKWAHESGLTA